jgi:hypothetical protein
MGPGLAAHHFVLRSIRGTAPAASTVHPVHPTFIWLRRNSVPFVNHEGGDVMERRHFLKLAFGAAGAAALAASAQAAPLAPYPLAESGHQPAAKDAVQPALTTTDEVNSLKPEEVHWRHRHWHHRHWHRRWHRYHRRHRW